MLVIAHCSRRTGLSYSITKEGYSLTYTYPNPPPAKEASDAMIVSTLGLYSSGSTWLFNVVRCICAKHSDKSFSVYADSGGDVMSCFGDEIEYLVIKSHHLDNDFLKIIRATSAKLIITVREARDGVTSLMNRFGTSESDALSQISLSASAIAVARNMFGHMIFVYEDRFMDNKDTIKKIADYIEVEISDDFASEILAQFDREKVASDITAQFEHASADITYDDATHWHVGHIGDGKSSKWSETLSDAAAAAIDEAINPFCQAELRPGLVINWSSYLFRHSDGRNLEAGQVITTGMNDHLLIYGPYLFLPPGRWRVDFRFRRTGVGGTSILKIDAILGYESGLLGSSAARLDGTDEQHCGFEFEHTHLSHPVETRVHAMSYGSASNVEFLGVRLTYLALVASNRGKALQIVSAECRETFEPSVM